MDLLVQTNAIKLFRQFFDRKVSTTPCVPFATGKPVFARMAASQPLPRVSPESLGVSSGYLSELLGELQRNPGIDLHTLTILRNGAVMLEAAFGAYRTDVWQLSHSFAKSITGTAIGMLIDEGRLSPDDTVPGIFEKRANPLTHLLQKKITVRHLLTMSSGVVLNEAGALTETDWVRAFLESGLKFEPGRSFDYNSMNSYMLSAIVHEITGEGLCDYLSGRLFEPLGIRNYHWECCPKGIEKGGWGLYILPEDMAKIGQLYLQRGEWNGKRLLSGEWVAAATAAQLRTPRKYGDFHYGYQIWAGRKHNCFLLNGMFGQNVLAFPRTGMMAVTTGGNAEVFQKGPLFQTLLRFLGDGYTPADHPLRAATADTRQLQQAIQSVKALPSTPPPPLVEAPKRRTLRLPRRAVRKRMLPPECHALDGRRITIDTESRNQSVGLLPVYAQLLQNNHTHGLDAVSFRLSGDLFCVTFWERDETHEMSVGFLSPSFSRLSFHGESHLVGVTGEFTQTDDHVPLLKLRVSFIETSFTRHIRFLFYGDRVYLELSESPGEALLQSGAGLLLGSARAKLLEPMLTKLDTDYLSYKTLQTLEPEIWGVLSPRASAPVAQLPVDQEVDLADYRA